METFCLVTGERRQRPMMRQAAADAEPVSGRHIALTCRIISATNALEQWVRL
jgi:hypothetical protein